MKIFRAILVAGAVGGFGLTLHAELANAIQAIVHDAVITRHDVEMFTKEANEQLVEKYLAQPARYGQEFAAAWKENLELLLERQLILHEFSTAGYNLPETVIEEYVQERIRTRFHDDRVTFTRTLQAEGLTSEKYRQRIREQFIIEQMQYKNVSGAVIVSPHKIESYYLAHKEGFKVEEEVKLRVIVLTNVLADATGVRARAEEIRAKIKEGTPFAEMASGYSQGRQGREGGDWGWVQKFDRDGAPVLRKELSEVAFSLQPGEVSDIIELQDVIYLMLVEDKRPAHLKALGEVRDEIERSLLREERDRLQKQWIERLRKKTFVRYF